MVDKSATLRRGFTKTTRSRVVIVETLYHQPPDEGAKSFKSNYLRWLSSDEQLYERTLELTTKWTKLDFGWAADPGLVLLRSKAERLHTVPTEKQSAELDALTVEISFDGKVPALLIRVAESTRIEPMEGVKVFARARSEGVKLSVVAVPR